MRRSLTMISPKIYTLTVSSNGWQGQTDDLTYWTYPVGQSTFWAETMQRFGATGVSARVQLKQNFIMDKRKSKLLSAWSGIQLKVQRHWTMTHQSLINVSTHEKSHYNPLFLSVLISKLRVLSLQKKKAFVLKARGFWWHIPIQLSKDNTHDNSPFLGFQARLWN